MGKETAANLRWKQRLDEQRQDRRTLDQAQDQVVRDNRVMGLLAKAGELDARITAASQSGPLTEWNAPLDLLRERVQTLQELDRAAKDRGMPGFEYNAPPVLTHPDTFPDGSKVQITQLDDGTIEARLATGETFKGDPLTVTRKIGESTVNTKRWAYGIRDVTQSKLQQPQQPQV